MLWDTQTGGSQIHVSAGFGFFPSLFGLQFVCTLDFLQTALAISVLTLCHATHYTDDHAQPRSYARTAANGGGAAADLSVADIADISHLTHIANVYVLTI